MIRTIVKSEDNKLTLDLPDNMIGKIIEVIAFEINEAVSTENSKNLNATANARKIDEALNSYRVDLSNFKFDRDEANDYE
jgi:hypothetical protein